VEHGANTMNTAFVVCVCSAPLPLWHGLELVEELPLRHSASEGLIAAPDHVSQYCIIADDEQLL